MSRRQFFLIRFLLLLATVGAVNTALALGGWYWLMAVAVIGIAVFLALSSLSPRKVKEVMTDERSRTIQEKASRIGILVFFLAAMIGGAVLIVITYRTDLGIDLSQAGFTLYFSALFISALVIALRKYYERKL